MVLNWVMRQLGPRSPRGAGPDGRLAIIAGSGNMPLHIARSAQRAGENPFIFRLEDEADADFSEFDSAEISIFGANALVEHSRKHEIGRLLFSGNVRRPDMRKLRVERELIKYIPDILMAVRGGDDHANSKIVAIFRQGGFEVVGPADIAPDIVAQPGVIAGKQPSRKQLDDINKGLNAIRQMGSLDIGQSIVVHQQRIVAVEAAEGTDAMIRRCADLRANGRLRGRVPNGVLVKAAKPGQERLLDLPTIGTSTIESVKVGQLAGIAVEAGSVLVPELEDVCQQAKDNGIFIYGISVEPDAE